MRGQQIIKLIKAIDLLSRTEGVTIEELASELQLDKRSIYRLITVIEELGVPIYDDKVPYERKKRWKLEESYLKKLPNLKLPDLTLAFSEVIALYFIKGQERLYKGTEVEKKINSAFTKLGAFIPEGLTGNIDKIKTLFISSSKLTKDYTGKEEIIDSLTDAMLKQKTCLIAYHSFSDDEIKSFKIDPLSFFENKGGLYIFVNASSFDNILVLAVERIQSIDVTESSFEPPTDFDPESRMETAFDIVSDDPIEVKVWFSESQARYVRERSWALQQRITENEDGSIMLEMKSSGWRDVKSWILSYGADAKVIEPEEMRKEIGHELATMRAWYEIKL